MCSPARRTCAEKLNGGSKRSRRRVLGVQSFQSIVHGPNFSVVGAGDIIGKEQEREQVDDLVGPPGGPYTIVMSTSSGSSHVVGGLRI